MSGHKIVGRFARHIFLGAALGYVVLHPISNVIHDVSEGRFESYADSVVSAFDRHHFRMAFYFTIVGAAFGLLSGLATHRQAVLHARIERLSVTDDLTGLYNRRFAMSSLEREVQRAQRYGNDLSLMMIDIDHFKAFNDAFGHPAGDRLLRQFAERLKKLTRRTDIVSRYGGEEFLILMLDTGMTMAVHLAERIRKDIETRAFDLGKDRPEETVTISIGCSRVDANGPSTGRDIIRKADECLYRAKNSGRNRICY